MGNVNEIGEVETEVTCNTGLIRILEEKKKGEKQWSRDNI